MPKSEDENKPVSQPTRRFAPSRENESSAYNLAVRRCLIGIVADPACLLIPLGRQCGGVSFHTGKNSIFQSAERSVGISLILPSLDLRRLSIAKIEFPFLIGRPSIFQKLFEIFRSKCSTHCWATSQILTSGSKTGSLLP